MLVVDIADAVRRKLWAWLSANARPLVSGAIPTTVGDGDRLVIQPVHKRGLAALLATMKPSDEDFPKIKDPPPAAEEVF